MAEDGLIDGKKSAFHRMGGVPKVTTLKIVDVDDGELIAEPDNWDPEAPGKPPRIIIREPRPRPGVKRPPALKRGDRILARTEETDRGWIAHPMKKLPSRTEGLMGVVEKDKTGKAWLAPVDKRVRQSTPIADLGEAEEGQLVIAERVGRSDRAGVKVIEVVGDPLAPKSFSLIAIAKHGIPNVFPDDALEEAPRAAKIKLSEKAREDLRHLPIVAIDPADARDHDDAIWAEPDGQGGFNALVAIADVSFYVRPGSALDREARKRGNSVYFPDRVVPMLPELLSNGLCSLRPHVPRLAMVVDTPYSMDGEAGPPRLYNAVIESQARLTYNQVQAALDGQPDQATTPLLPMLRDAEELARVFMRRRKERGCLDFDIPEAQVRMVEDIVSVHAGTRLFSHRLIEEFMIAANERVAEYLGARERVFPYRIHPQPDEKKLETLRKMLSHTSLVDRLPKELDQKGLQQLTHAADGTDIEFLVNRLVLRTMMQAQYSPDNDGHYGLASEAYCHFTSPIRRYADLLVHRSLKRLLAGEAETMGMEDVQGICEGLNALERKAMEAEREIQKRAAILALEGRVGEEMRGVVSGVADFGFWVELLDMPVDGLVRLANLDDYYVFDPERQDLLGQRTGKTFAMGQTLTVILEAVSLERVEINFTLP